MSRYAWLGLAMILVFAALFGLVEALDVPLLADPHAVMDRGGITAASVGVSLLIADVLIPVPSSVVMVAHGALFGVVLGAAISLVGNLGAAWFGFWLGRRGGPTLDRIMSADERRRGDEMLARWGMMAIVATRPVPMLAETIVILAGTSGLTWRQLTLATVAGSLPAAVLLAMAGATGMALDSSLLVFGLVLMIAAAFWLWGRRLGRQGGTA
jgi:uncharacterized membrane protein YdjX (TVP38/TMEM64 family)